MFAAFSDETGISILCERTDKKKAENSSFAREPNAFQEGQFDSKSSVDPTLFHFREISRMWIHLFECRDKKYPGTAGEM
jgi:hypothetical protein